MNDCTKVNDITSKSVVTKKEKTVLLKMFLAKLDRSNIFMFLEEFHKIGRIGKIHDFGNFVDGMVGMK